jgi:guanylate kinase
VEYDRHNAAIYGTPWGQLREKLADSNVILDIEPKGAEIVHGKRPDATLIFIMPPSMEELERRLRGRGDTCEEQIALRMDRAKWEMDQRPWYDYVVVNDNLEDCVNEILNIIAKTAD